MCYFMFLTLIYLARCLEDSIRQCVHDHWHMVGVQWMVTIIMTTIGVICIPEPFLCTSEKLFFAVLGEMEFKRIFLMITHGRESHLVVCNFWITSLHKGRASS